MRMFFVAIAFAMLGSAVAAQDARRRVDGAHASPSTARPESPFACDVRALTPEARRRHFDELGPQLRSMRTGVRELTNGYAFQFPADPKTVRLVAEWAAGERLCCPFFEIDMRMEPEGGPLWLSLTGREGTKDFIRADAPAWTKP